MLRGELYLNLKCQKSVKRCNKEPLMQFCPDSKLVGTLSNNSLLNHLDYVRLIPLYKKSPVFFFSSHWQKVWRNHNKFTSRRPGFKKKKMTLGSIQNLPQSNRETHLDEHTQEKTKQKNNHYGTDINNDLHSASS